MLGIFRIFLATLSWGPTARTDDPHDGFETNAAVVTGASKFKDIENAYAALQAYAKLTTIDQKAVQSVAPKLAIIINSKVPDGFYPLKAANWLEVAKAPHPTYKLKTIFSNETEVESVEN